MTNCFLLKTNERKLCLTLGHRNDDRDSCIVLHTNLALNQQEAARINGLRGLHSKHILFRLTALGIKPPSQ